MKLLIVENNKNDINELITLIENYNKNHEIKLTYKIDYDYNHVLEIVEEFDLILMDIELDNNVNGIELAREIRKYSRDIKIIFVSNYNKYLINGYKAKADAYWLKPVAQIEFNNDIDELSWEYIYNNAGFYDIRYSSKKIYYHEITYIEMNARKLHIHLVDGNTFVNNDSLLKWEEKLMEYPFSQPHRSFLVNLEQIQTFNKKEIILNSGERLQITDVYFDKFRKDYIRYLNRRV